jgi:hypothetical protein
MTELEKAQIIIQLCDLEKISREVGFLNATSNIKEYDEHDNESYDIEAIKQYEELRDKQLKLLNALIDKFTTAPKF